MAADHVSGVLSAEGSIEVAYGLLVIAVADVALATIQLSTELPTLVALADF